MNGNGTTDGLTVSEGRKLAQVIGYAGSWPEESRQPLNASSVHAYRPCRPHRLTVYVAYGHSGGFPSVRYTICLNSASGSPFEYLMGRSGPGGGVVTALRCRCDLIPTNQSPP